MHFATFYEPSAVDNNVLLEACDDRAVIILDGRSSLSDRALTARHECRRHGFKGYQLHVGETFTRSKPVSVVYVLEN